MIPYYPDSDSDEQYDEYGERLLRFREEEKTIPPNMYDVESKFIEIQNKILSDFRKSHKMIDILSQIEFDQEMLSQQARNVIMQDQLITSNNIN